MFDGVFGGFNATKLKPQLKMACGRIQIASNKKSALLKQSMREVAVLLAEDPPKEEKAKIRAEALIRDDNLIEAYEILQLECELLHERIKLLQYSKTCPPDLVPVVSTLMWASHRVDIPELLLIRKQFVSKYGKIFEENAMRNIGGCLNERVVHKLSVEPPAAYLVQTYLERICEQFSVDYTPSMKLSADEMIEPMAPPVGYSVSVAQGTGLGPNSQIIASTTGSTTTTQPQQQVNNDDNTTTTTTSNDTMLPPAMPTAPSFRTNTTTTPASAGGTTKKDDTMFDEPDIFVPGPPSAKPKPKPPPATNNDDDDPEIVIPPKNDDDEDKKNDDNDDNNGDVSDSYADLAARFDSLKK